MKVTKCDICGNICKDEQYKISLTNKLIIGSKNSKERTKSDIDICVECYHKLPTIFREDIPFNVNDSDETDIIGYDFDKNILRDTIGSEIVDKNVSDDKSWVQSCCEYQANSRFTKNDNQNYPRKESTLWYWCEKHSEYAMQLLCRKILKEINKTNNKSTMRFIYDIMKKLGIKFD